LIVLASNIFGIVTSLLASMFYWPRHPSASHLVRGQRIKLQSK